MKDEKRLCAKNGNNFNTYVQKQNKIKYQCNTKQRQSSLNIIKIILITISLEQLLRGIIKGQKCLNFTKW